MLHSGSRGIGNQLAQQHIEGAKGLMRRYYIELPDDDLAYLVEGTAEFDADAGVIPGSMGTRSHIVDGQGSGASYHSCSHGAGRRVSRGAARRQLDTDGLRQRMRGRAWNDDDAARLIDEDPRAYKDIDQVMGDSA